MSSRSPTNSPSSSTTIETTDGDVLHGKAQDIIERFPANEFHAIVTDPPYSIDFRGEDWDNFRRRDNDADVERSNFGGRLSSTSPAHGAESDPYEYHKWTMMWAERAKRVLKPGGHILVFGSNRTHHRVQCALEDVGFEIRDTIPWLYGEGMPKAPRLKRWLDDEHVEEYGEWRGTLKPAAEFITLARAPLGASSATQNMVEHGVGALNVVEAELDSGRYPPNVILDEVMAHLLDEMVGERDGCHPHQINEERGETVYQDGLSDSTRFEGYDDSGGPSRFFYCSKASKSEKTHDGAIENNHPTVKPLDVMEWLVTMVTAEGQKVLDPFCGSGTTLLAAQNVGRETVGIEMQEEHVTTAQQRLSQ